LNNPRPKLYKNVTVRQGERIDISADEINAGKLSAAHFRHATMLLHCHGMVVLRGALPLGFVSEMKAEYDVLLADCLASTSGKSLNDIPWTSQQGTTFWVDKGRLRAFMKLKGAFSDSRLVANPFVCAILNEILGDGFYCNTVSSDTCMAGSEFQTPHRDIGFYPTGETCGAIVNVPLVHCGLHNGPLEVWPGGSHLWRRDLFAKYEMKPFGQDVRHPELEAFAERIPSRQLELAPGDILLRDPGMLHRGTPNPTLEPRVMLTLGYFRAGYVYKFGDPKYNLDTEIFDGLSAEVQKLVAYRFKSGIGYPMLRG
jgi:ectoine hydroxylase-related dioxygenase (phytanoyl-CoA dioxygenase family)